MVAGIVAEMGDWQGTRYDKCMTASPMTIPERRRFTAEEYHRLGEVGVLRSDERVELINGEVFHMSPIGPRHNAIVARLIRHFSKLSDRTIVWAQSSIRIDQHGEPEPDVGLLKPRADFYEDGQPEPQDTLLLVEVADTSLAFDLNIKQRYYAVHGIPETWIVDAIRKVIHVFRDPYDGEYRLVRQFTGDDLLAPLAFADDVAPVHVMIGA